MDYQSFQEFASAESPGVAVVVKKMSFGRRVELMRRIRELSRQHDFHAAGPDSEDQIEAGILSASIDRIYFDWGIESVSGLLIDGVLAGLDLVLEKGPEELFRECVALVKSTCQLTEPEIKN